MSISPTHHNLHRNFNTHRNTTLPKRHETYDFYTQVRQLPAGEVAEAITKAIQTGIPLTTTPEELLLTDWEKVRDHAQMGRSRSDREMALKMKNAIQRSQSLGEVWNGADEEEKDAAKQLYTDVMKLLHQSGKLETSDRAAKNLDLQA